MPFSITIIVLAFCIFTAIWLYREKLLNQWSLKVKAIGEVIEYYSDTLFWKINKKTSLVVAIINMVFFWALASLISAKLIIFLPSPFHFLLSGIVGYILSLKFSDLLPRGILSVFRRIRIARFDRLLVDTLTLLANSLKSGLSLMQSMQLIIEQMPDPVSQEFSLVISQQNLGVTIERSIENLGERIPTDDVKMMVNSVTCLRQTGGNIAEVLLTLSQTIRERKKVEEKVNALTAQGRLQGLILVVFPFALLFIMNCIDPSYLKPLFENTIGYLVLGGFLFMQLVGGIWIWKIVNIKV